MEVVTRKAKLEEQYCDLYGKRVSASKCCPKPQIVRYIRSVVKIVSYQLMYAITDSALLNSELHNTRK